MRKLLIVSALLMLGSSALAQEVTSTNGLYPREDIELYVPAGKSRAFAMLWGGVNFAECTFWNPKDIEVRVVQEPEHGAFQLIEQQITAAYKADHPAVKCNGKKAGALKAQYKANDKFVGTDEFELFIMWPNGKGQERHITVNVK
jgi:hypothetical protein